jgi:hypothetical protein
MSAVKARERSNIDYWVTIVLRSPVFDSLTSGSG